MLRKGIQFALTEFKEFFENLGIVCKYLTVLGIISLSVVCISIFHPELDATGNLVTIRTAFSSIAGYILEKSTKNCTSNQRLLKNKILLVGSFAVIAMLITTIAYVLNIDVNNPSLILIKNLLFSSIGFLTSASKDFTKKDS
ncbi:MAG: hypothetical protein ACRCYC_01115 [Paraclostridium sp.]|uniref:hypothetical protein n=1 Tax=Paraclostridium sp. TaxID=2023273 RepID=UPI003F393CC5